MDVDDPCGNDSFYDEIDSLMPAPGDYNLDDIEEILRSTDTQLDASLDFNSFNAPSDLYNFDIKNEYKGDSEVFGFSNFSSHDETQQRTSSISSAETEEEKFNPDEFINFLNDDSIKFEEYARDSDYSNNSMDAMPNRNTPSPTGSCSSSGGSSTSGIQSDASSVGSMTPAYVSQQDSKPELMDNMEFMKMEPENNFILSPPTTVVPLSLPVVSLHTAMAPVQTVPAGATIIQPIPQIIQGTIIPVKTVPVNTIAPVTNVKPIIPTPIKIEPKLAPKVNTTTPAPKIVTNANVAEGNGIKVAPVATTKPKTVFLSSSDFKTIMQRMNSNGAKGGATITGTINAQMPKIIMKTQNGKVITTNKIVQPLSTVNNKGASGQFMTKIVTANGSQLVIKQQQQQQQHATKSNTSTAPAPSIYKGIIDEKMLKKQQRMIKNRESASLSRKKKKEYVVSLETRINNLEKENYTLKGENKSLRSQLVAFAQTCHCKHSNISEFILNSLNAAENKSQHVKIAPKPSPKSIKQRMSAANVRKNVAVLFAMAFMVTLNVGNFQSFLNKNSLEAGMAEQIVEEPLPQTANAAGGRRLLWVETEAEFNEKLNRSKRDLEMEVPPLHFLRPINRTASGQQRNGNATVTETETTAIGNNHTENLRLASSLRKWIGGNANYLNLSSQETFTDEDDLENPTGFKITSDYYDMRTYDLPLQAPSPGVGGTQKRKYYVDERLSYGGKQRKLETENEIDHNSLELFKPQISEEYVRLFQGIKRQDDTFYVLSFNMDHILLPASNYNKSSRPKMSLMLPAGFPDLNGDVTLMQIDCEVTNTTELMLKSHMIPEKLRPHKFTKGENDVVNNETANAPSKLRERFIRRPTTAAVEDKAQPKKVESVADRLVIKQKPVVRTFYLMGPKTQAAADAAKKKPTIVKLSSNETVVNGVITMKNSTLFSKMREANVEGNTP